MEVYPVNGLRVCGIILENGGGYGPAQSATFLHGCDKVLFDGR